ncbi:hypothetical protein ACETU7_27290 [Rhodococcus sp. 3Y1]
MDQAIAARPTRLRLSTSRTEIRSRGSRNTPATSDSLPVIVFPNAPLSTWSLIKMTATETSAHGFSSRSPGRFTTG